MPDIPRMILHLLKQQLLPREQRVLNIDNYTDITIFNIRLIIFIMRSIFATDCCGDVIDHSAHWL